MVGGLVPEKCNVPFNSETENVPSCMLVGIPDLHVCTPGQGMCAFSGSCALSGQIANWAHSTTRADWSQEFFRGNFLTPLSPSDVPVPIAVALEAVRWGPSACNYQTNRILLIASAASSSSIASRSAAARSSNSTATHSGDYAFHFHCSGSSGHYKFLDR